MKINVSITRRRIHVNVNGRTFTACVDKTPGRRSAEWYAHRWSDAAQRDRDRTVAEMEHDADSAVHASTRTMFVNGTPWPVNGNGRRPDAFDDIRIRS